MSNLKTIVRGIPAREAACIVRVQIALVSLNPRDKRVFMAKAEVGA